MSTINKFFNKVFCISLTRRRDRRLDFYEEFHDVFDFEWFDGYDHPTSGHCGCSRSHRELLRKIAKGPWETCLVMEDDANIITLPHLKAAGFGPNHPVWKTYCSVMNGEGNLNERFDYVSQFIPDHFDVLYLGASYGEPPIGRLNKHIIRTGFMKTTSSYGITREFAKEWTEKVDADTGGSLENHPGPIDDVFGSFAKDHLYYVLQPRMIYQRKSHSDIEGITTCHLFSQTDWNKDHEGSV